MKTKISLMLLGLGLAYGSAYAGAMAEPMPVSNDINVTAPDQSGMWSFGATALLMQPITNNFSYLETDTDNTVKFKEVNQSYHWWFGADVTYAFPGNGRDVTLAYEGMQGTDSNKVHGLSPLTNTLGVTNVTVEGEVKTNYNAGDLLFGQKLDVGQRIRLHPFIGLRYAYIQEKDTASANGYDDSATLIASGSDVWKGTFSGIGPRFGSDAQINLGEGFSVRGRLGMSALMGSSNPDFSGVEPTIDAGAVTGLTSYSIDHDSSTRVVPELDGRLGLNYMYNFDSNMALGVEAGWQAINYFNAVAQTDFDTVDHENFALQGPYARLQLDIA